MPGDPVYGFPEVVYGDGSKAYADPGTRDFFGLAAKGNIVIGDYTSAAFQQNVLPTLDGGPTSKTQAYAIDQTDTALGYHNSGFDAEGRPLFDGNYNQRDQQDGLPGTKLDGSERKFYESTLSDAAFQALVAQFPPPGTMSMDGVLFTNHALAGLIPSSLTVNGSLVGRDDGLIFSESTLRINHDLRLVGSAQGAEDIVLPFSVLRPRLTVWGECAPSGC
jgi:hypothetical protein